MSDVVVPTSFYQRGSMVTLGVGVCLSLAVHLGVGLGASEYFASSAISKKHEDRAIAMEPERTDRVESRDELRLGMEESKVASINWLGVVENPEVGDVPEAEVEQAEFTRQIGDSEVTTSPEPQVQVQPPEQPPEQPADLAAVLNPVQEVVDEVQSEVVAEPIEQALTEQIELEVETKEAEALIEVQPEPVEKEQVEQEVVESVDSETEATELAPTKESSEEPVEVESAETGQPADKPTAKPEQAVEDSQEVTPRVAGKAGEQSEKESAASKIKRALRVDGADLHKPIVGKGIELTTVEPRFPASVRFRELPRNPVLIIRFNGLGRVIKVSFLTEGRRVYDTGVKGVDEPLINAVYQWRAKGKEIEALDAKDPESFLEIPMRITFRKERELP
tara:strand:+ start:2483 stop:3658 length:1176 start_codon:yes stop_codon:yes gene_type:complete